MPRPPVLTAAPLGTFSGVSPQSFFVSQTSWDRACSVESHRNAICKGVPGHAALLRTVWERKVSPELFCWLVPSHSAHLHSQGHRLRLHASLSAGPGPIVAPASLVHTAHSWLCLSWWPQLALCIRHTLGYVPQKSLWVHSRSGRQVGLRQRYTVVFISSCGKGLRRS